jgi:hypothetical protein
LLYLGDGFEGMLGLAATKVPKSEYICCYKNDIGSIYKSFILRRETSRGIAKHMHCFNQYEGFGGIELSVLIEDELVVKVLKYL